MAVHFTEPPIETPFMDESGSSMTNAWREWLSTLARELNEAIEDLETKMSEATFTQVQKGDDAVNVTTVDAESGSDQIDMAALNAKLVILATEINAVVAVTNDIWDKLEAGGFVRESG